MFWVWSCFSHLSVTRCQRLLPPFNGFFVGHCGDTYGSRCVMGCNEGYYLNGSATTTCLVKPGHLTGYWDTAFPTCKSKLSIIWHPLVTFFLRLNINVFLSFLFRTHVLQTESTSIRLCFSLHMYNISGQWNLLWLRVQVWLRYCRQCKQSALWKWWKMG